MILEALFLSGRIVEIILAFVFAEAILLAVLLRRRSFSFRLSLLANIAAGGFLMLALRLALTDEWWGYIAGSLAASFAAHLVDLIGRLRSRS